MYKNDYYKGFFIGAHYSICLTYYHIIHYQINLGQSFALMKADRSYAFWADNLGCLHCWFFASFYDEINDVG